MFEVVVKNVTSIQTNRTALHYFLDGTNCLKVERLSTQESSRLGPSRWKEDKLLTIFAVISCRLDHASCLRDGLRKQDGIHSQRHTPPHSVFCTSEKQKVGGVKKEEKKKEEKEKEKKKKSVCWPTLPQGAWVKEVKKKWTRGALWGGGGQKK